MSESIPPQRGVGEVEPYVRMTFTYRDKAGAVIGTRVVERVGDRENVREEGKCPPLVEEEENE